MGGNKRPWFENLGDGQEIIHTNEKNLNLDQVHKMGTNLEIKY